MKITEAPEKIYLIRNIPSSTTLNTTNDCHEKYLQEWYTEREKDSDVEYTRTDVLINKLEQWIKKTFTETDHRFKQDYTGMLLSNFRFYIKGE